MESLKIATFNVKDNKVNQNGGNREDGLSNAIIVSNIMRNFDLIGTQEFTIKYLNNVMSNLDSYQAYGDYRYGNLLTKMPYNETNSIITNQSVITDETYSLPFVADNINDLVESIVKMSIMPRIATIIIFKTKAEKEMCMINTHLDYQVLSIQIRQLNALKNLVLKYSENYPIILTGDFNMELGEKQFSDFVTSVNDVIKPVEVSSASLIMKDGSSKSVDHIFVPKNSIIEDAGITNSSNTSDHNLVYVKIRNY